MLAVALAQFLIMVSSRGFVIVQVLSADYCIYMLKNNKRNIKLMIDRSLVKY